MGTIEKIILSAFMCVALFGCGNNAQKKVEQAAPPQYALREMIDSCFQAQPTANNNDITRSIFADTLKSKIQRFKGISLPYIEDVPLQYEMCLPYPGGQEYVVKFNFGEITSKCVLSDKYETTFQIFAVIDKETTATLVDGELYHIKGIFRDFANNSKETGFTLPSGKCVVSYPSVTDINGKPFINLGTLVVDNLSFSQIKEQ